MTQQNWKIGDCQDLMKEMESDSVDLIITDPPYGYSFMGKDWDRAVPTVNLWEEALRVLKPGAFAFIMSAPRQDVLAHNLVNLSDAGFDTAFTSMYWAYASGFPKAGNIGKMVDKRNGRHPEQYTELGLYLRKMRGKRQQKNIAKRFPSKTGGLTGCVANWELGLNVPTTSQWKILKQELDLDDRFDKLIEREEAEREVIGKKEKLNAYSDIGFSSGSGKYEKTTIDITTPSTTEAKVLDGSYGGFQPKPAVEVIMVVMKPLSEKTYVDQALANQKGITWLDDGRIPYQSDADIENATPSNVGELTTTKTYGRKDCNPIPSAPNTQGRFPANLLVSDDVLNDGIQHRGGITNFSRYFNLDTWWNDQIKYLPKEVKKTFPFIITPKASKKEKNGSTHPTIKPVKLFTYLITIGSREGDLVLDPFLGSGTILQSGRLTNRNIIGFELDPQWEELYSKRAMKNIPNLLSLG